MLFLSYLSLTSLLIALMDNEPQFSFLTYFSLHYVDKTLRHKINRIEIKVITIFIIHQLAFSVVSNWKSIIK